MATKDEKKEYKVIPLYMDLQAKNLFGTERNVVFTENLLENYFGYEKGGLRGCEITNSVVITSELIKGKKVEMDIRVKLPDEEIVNLEFYSVYDDMSEIKSFMYITKVFSSQLKSGEIYGNIKRIKQINFIYEDRVRKDDKVIKRYAVINRDDPFDYILRNNFEIDIVNLANKNELAYNGINEGLADWIKFIGAKAKEEMQQISKGKHILEEALREMERFSNNEEIQDLFSIEMMEKSREKYNKEKAEEEAKKREEKGARNKAIEIAKKMLKENLDIELISRVSGLSKQELENL